MFPVIFLISNTDEIELYLLTIYPIFDICTDLGGGQTFLAPQHFLGGGIYPLDFFYPQPHPCY